MKPQEKIEQLTAELTAAKEREANLLKEIETLKSQKSQAPSRSSKSREQAQAVAELVKQGPVTTAQLAALNQKYPSDPIYYYRTLLNQKVERARIGGQSVYMTPEQFAVWQQGQAKEKEQKAAEAATEGPQAPPAEQASGATAAAAA